MLNISDKSLTIEIIGHVYIETLQIPLKEIPRIPKIAPIIVKKRIKLFDHTDIIDCKEVDSNRCVDKLAVLYDTIMNNMYEVFQRMKRTDSNIPLNRSFVKPLNFVLLQFKLLLTSSGHK